MNNLLRSFLLFLHIIKFSTVLICFLGNSICLLRFLNVLFLLSFPVACLLFVVDDILEMDSQLNIVTVHGGWSCLKSKCYFMCTHETIIISGFSFDIIMGICMLYDSTRSQMMGTFVCATKRYESLCICTSCLWFVYICEWWRQPGQNVSRPKIIFISISP